MSTTPTPNKGYSMPTPGTETGAWGGVLNNEVFERIDTNLGGVLPLALSSSPVVLTAAEARNVLFPCTGLLSGSVEITNPAAGFYIVENLTTGAFSLTVTNGVGSPVTVPQGQLALLIADSSNGVRVIGFGSPSNNSLEPFPAGTTTPFLQAAVPTGWTLDSTYNNYLLKLSNATGGVIGGSVPVATLFARTTTDGHAVTVPQLPAHHHATGNLDSTSFSGFEAVPHWMGINTGTDGIIGTTDQTGSGNAHSHALELRARRVTAVIGVRNS